MTPAPPYDEMDPPVVTLCRVINDSLPGLATIGSCGGHEGGLRDPDGWYVLVEVQLADDRRPTLEAWVSLEFLSWALRDIPTVWFEPTARPPYLNFPGKMLRFVIEGQRTKGEKSEPDDIAAFIQEVFDRLYVDAEYVEQYETEMLDADEPAEGWGTTPVPGIPGTGEA